MQKHLLQEELVVIPSSTSSARDFDFLQGKWIVHNRKLQSRLTRCKEWITFDAAVEMNVILLGLGNTDRFVATTQEGKSYEAIALRLFNPVTRLWSIYWADSNFGTLDKPVIGSFEDKNGKFYTRDFHEGTPIIMQFNWDVSDRERPVWSQAYSPDDGSTWEWNWYMELERTG
jgi:hypothetical protein